MKGIAYEQALSNLQQSDYATPPELTDKQTLLKQYHPDYQPGSTIKLTVGVNKGDDCPTALANLLQSNSPITDADLAGALVVNTEVLVVGGGGAGCAAALEISAKNRKVILVTKLRIGDSNTVMAEGGIQAAIGEDDSPQRHFEDTLKAGHLKADRQLVAQLALSAPGTIRWLIEQGMSFDREDETSVNSKLLRKKPGGATRSRILSLKDYTGLEMMRVLREAVELDEHIDVWNRCPLVELLSDEEGNCVGGIIYDLSTHRFVLIRASKVILATGGAGRLHLNDFPTSNHYGATADGLVLAYRMGAKIREIDSFQYHPTGVAWPSYRLGGLISEAARSAGAYLINGEGKRFIDELLPRDIVSAAILKECAEGRGVVREEKTGVFLDIPDLERRNPGILKNRLVSLSHLGKQCNIDLTKEPIMVRPTLHYQNGGVIIDENGSTTVPNLYCVGEVTGGIHGRNRMMGNALQEIITFGRKAGQHAATTASQFPAPKVGLFHLYNWQRELILSCVDTNTYAPILFPKYSNFDFYHEISLRSKKANPLNTKHGKE